jgi:hypothetical protein
VRGWLALAALGAAAVAAWAVALAALGFTAVCTLLAAPRAPGAVLAADRLALHALAGLLSVLT